MTVPTPAAPQKKVMVASFQGATGAKAALERLKAGGARLGNVALVQRQLDGSVEFSETQDWGLGKSAAVGALAAMLLPGIGVVMGAIGGAAAAYFIDAGFPDALLKQMGSGIPVGTSLLVGLVDESDTVHAERIVGESGGTVLGSGLEADLTQVLERMRGQ